MTPPDTDRPLHPSPSSPLAPPYIDEDVNQDSVKQGMNAAEDEVREAVADAYEEAARRTDDTEAALDDIDRGGAEKDDLPAELAAMHQEVIREEEG